MKNELRRAELYRSLGREGDAQRVEAELARLLRNADPDFPILRELRRRQAIVSSKATLSPGTLVRRASEVINGAWRSSASAT
jgi:hypothetical protein